MLSFLLYLFESGLCLSILFLVYIFFFRKETYFRFNRIYLISILFFSLIIPFIHVSFNVSNIQKFKEPITGIGKFRNYYEQIIAMTDPEFLDTRKNQYSSDFEESNYDSYTKFLKSSADINTTKNTTEINQTSDTKRKFKPSIAQIFFVIYIIGAIVFLTRILFLFRWIYKTIASNPVKSQNNIKLVEVNEKLPPFSFLKYVFLNKDIINNKKVNQILAHEKIHITQNHTIDLLLAHFLTIFHWFNPIAWRLHKAIKTNHEYIADNEVIGNGFDLYNYQELLLNQFLTIRSVELVNNFNLLSIKKRIAMLNKVKSGSKAKFKALLIIPAAILTFFLFANLTINGPDKVLNNFSFFENQFDTEQLKGLWENNSEDTYGQLIKFSIDKFSVLEDHATLKEYHYKIKDNNIVLDVPNGNPIALKFVVTNTKIKIWWNDLNSTEFTKTNFENSLDLFLAKKNLKITPPTTKNYKILARQELSLFVGIHENKVIVQDQVGEFADLEKLILEERSKFNQLDLNIVTIQLAVDKNTEMKQIYELQQILRRTNLLKIGYVCYPDDNTTNLNLPTAFTLKIPPLDGIDIIEIEDLPAMGIEYFEIDATDKENTSVTIEPKLTKFISESEKYITALIYNNSTIFEDYINYMDMAWSVIINFRNQYAIEKYNIEYKSLGKELQNVVKKKYPIIIPQKNVDEYENELKLKQK